MTPPESLMYTLDMLSEHSKYFGSDGTQYDGMTRVVKVLDKPALVGAANRLGLKGIRIEDEWYGHQANRGKVAHGRIEAWVRDIPFDSSNIDGELMNESDPSLERFKEFWVGEDFELIEAERWVAVDELRVGGRLDLLARPRKRGGVALLEVKTGGGFYAEQKLQAAGYEALITRPHRWNPTQVQSPSGWVKADPIDVTEVWLARVGKDEPGDMDKMLLSTSELELHRTTVLGMIPNHYNLKRVLARR